LNLVNSNILRNSYNNRTIIRSCCAALCYNYIGGLIGCDLHQINERPNDNGTFLDLVFANVPFDMAVEGAEIPLLKLDYHQKAYEIEMQIC
jgi:hypothetical protein